MSKFKNQVSSEFKEFINDSLSGIEKIFNDILKNIAGKKFEGIYKNKIESILKDINNPEVKREDEEFSGDIRSKFDLYSSKFKFYTQETERSLRKFGFLMDELLKEIEFNKEAFEKEGNEIYLLNIVNKWSMFNSSVKELFYNIEHSKYPYTIHSFFSIAFVLIPFINIISLIGGIYLVTKRDWRALTFGVIILIVYFVQIINGTYLMLYG